MHGNVCGVVQVGWGAGFCVLFGVKRTFQSEKSSTANRTLYVMLGGNLQQIL